MPGDWSNDKLIRLRVCGSNKLGDIDVDDAFYPAEEPSVVKVRDHICVFWFGFYERFVTQKEDPSFEERLMAAIGPGTAYYFGLVSNVNLYALIAWQGGQRTRRLVGWSEEVNFDEGAPLPHEAVARERFRVEPVGGLPRFHDETSGEVHSHDAIGETFVMAASAAVFGAPLDSQAALAALPARLPRYETWDAHCARIYG
jgi:hypothetical protein